MNTLPALFVALFVAILLIISGGVFSESIATLIHRRVPAFSYEGSAFLLWGSLVIASFAAGLIVMYLFLRG